MPSAGARDPASGANIGGANVSGLTTRNFQTTVELRDGQTLAVAGLIQTSSGNASRVPRLRLESSEQQEIEYLLQTLIRFHLERQVKS